MIRARSILAFMAVSMFAVSQGGMARAVVLCIGADGHVKIENAFGGTCDPAPEVVKPLMSPAGQVISGSAPRQGHCGLCVDVPLQSGTEDHQPVAPERSQLRLNTPMMVAPSAAYCRWDRHVRDALGRGTPPQGASILDALRTVILIA